jgi:deoxyadenosine/deoxycytidine kinase
MIISLEGNIGSGKEAFLQFLKKKLNDEVVFLEDSVYNWDNESLLNNFYRNPERWAFTLEVYSTTQKCQRLKELSSLVNRGSVIISRRSHISDKECFLKTCKQMKYITEKEMNIYLELFNIFSVPKIGSIIYLKSNVNKCFEHIISKQNGFEKTINFDYIQKLNQNYENWIREVKKNGIPILEIDIEKYRDIDGNEKLQEQLFEIVTKFFPTLKKFIKTKGTEYKKEEWTTVKHKKKTKLTTKLENAF